MSSEVWQDTLLVTVFLVGIHCFIRWVKVEIDCIDSSDTGKSETMNVVISIFAACMYFSYHCTLTHRYYGEERLMSAVAKP